MRMTARRPSVAAGGRGHVWLQQFDDLEQDAMPGSGAGGTVAGIPLIDPGEFDGVVGDGLNGISLVPAVACQLNEAPFSGRTQMAESDQHCALTAGPLCGRQDPQPDVECEFSAIRKRPSVHLALRPIIAESADAAPAVSVLKRWLQSPEVLQGARRNENPSRSNSAPTAAAVGFVPAAASPD